MDTEMSNPVFISYSRRSSASHASALVERLRSLAFFDTTDIDDGDEFPQRLFDALLDARLVVIFASSDYAKSRWGQLEMRLAIYGLDEAGSRIVVGLGSESRTVLEAMPPVVANANWPNADESQRLAELVTQRLATVSQPLRNRLGEDAATRLQLAFQEETSLPQPRKLEVPCSLPEVMSLRSIGPRFVGRADKLREIHRVLFEGALTSAPMATRIVGGPGSGKTRLMTEYLNRYGNYYPGGVFWVDAAAPSLDAEFWRVLSDLDPTTPTLPKMHADNLDIKRMLGRTLRSIGKPVLYLIDNIPESGAGDATRSLTDFCPAAGAVTVLSTSRQDTREAGVRVIDAESLKRNAAVLLLTDRVADASCTSWDTWERLSSWVGDLPYALDLLNAGLALGAVTVRELLQASESADSSTAELDEVEQSLRPLVPAGALAGVTSTFRVSFDKLRQNAQDLAYVLAHLAPEPIPMEFVTSLPEPLGSGSARAVLRSHHLVSGGNDLAFGAMHRLTSDFLRTLRRSDSAELLQAIGRRLAVEMRPERLNDPRQWSLMNLYRAHAAFLFDRIASFPSFDPECIGLGALAAHIAGMQGVYSEARALQVRVLDLSQQVLGERHPESLKAMGNLAGTLAMGGDLVEARKYQERVVQLTREVLGEEHPDTLVAMNNLGETLRMLGEFPTARALQQRVLDANDRIGHDRPETLAAMNNLALTLQSQGDLKSALPLLQAAARISEHVFGPESPNTLRALNNLAVNQRSVGEFAEARKLGEKIVAIAQESLGAENPDTLRAIHSLAATMVAQGDFNKARELQEFVWEARKRILGDEHPDTVTAMANLASTLGKLGDLRGELELEERTLEVRTRVLGEKHPDTLAAMNNLAVTVKALGNLPRAKKLLTDGLKATVDLLGPEHPDTLLAMDNLADAYAEEGDLAKAFQLEDYVVKTSRRVLGPDHPETMSAMANLGETLRSLGHFAEARSLQEVVLEGRMRILGPDNPETLTSMANLGVTLVQGGDKKAGMDLIRRTYDGRRKICGEEHPETVLTAKVLHSL
jgi:tetratricopeptide (TPR) repeat protein